jgi:hypothetical protein
MAKRQANGGRPSKGDRELFVTRVPKPVALVIRERAEELDLSYSEYLAGLLATALEMPEHAPSMPKDRDQEELPLTRAS